MKNKSAVCFVLGLMLFLGSALYAASGVRGAKSVSVINGNTSVIGISTGAAVVYSVILGTGAVTDFVTLFDSASSAGITNIAQTGNFRVRVNAASTASITVVNFDPPMQFNNGLMAANGTSLVPSTIIWEKGRVAQGY